MVYIDSEQPFITIKNHIIAALCKLLRQMIHLWHNFMFFLFFFVTFSQIPHQYIMNKQKQSCFNLLHYGGSEHALSGEILLTYGTLSKSTNGQVPFCA